MHYAHNLAEFPAARTDFDTFLTIDIRVGRIAAAVVNFAPRQIGKFMSELLTLGFPDAQGEVVLFAPDHDVPIGARLF